jgi:hypothetical protein
MCQGLKPVFVISIDVGETPPPIIEITLSCQLYVRALHVIAISRTPFLSVHFLWASKESGHNG